MPVLSVVRSRHHAAMRGGRCSCVTVCRHRISTNWSHLLPPETWWHVAVVNDGTHTVMYVDGCPVLSNPSTPAAGIATTGEFWRLGAYDYARVVETSFYGWLGDVRVVGRPLSPDEFLNHIGQ